MGYRSLSRCRSELMGCAMLWVLLFHATDLEVHSWLLKNIQRTGFGGVDLFILLSAMGLVMSLERKPQEYGSFLRRRGQRILPAYYAVMIPYTLLLILRRGAPWSALLFNGTLLSYWVRCSGQFNWYICGIACFYLLLPPVYAGLKRCRHRKTVTAVTVVISLALCQMLMQEGYWNYLDIFYRVPVFLIGILMGFFATEDRKLQLKDYLFWGGSFLAGIAYMLLSLQSMGYDGTLYFPLCHVFVLTTVPMGLLLAGLMEKLPLSLLRRGLRWVGERSLEIYLLNVTLFAEIKWVRRVLPTGKGNWLYWIFSWALNLLLGGALHWGIQWLTKKWLRQIPADRKEEKQ